MTVWQATTRCSLPPPTDFVHFSRTNWFWVENPSFGPQFCLGEKPFLVKPQDLVLLGPSLVFFEAIPAWMPDIHRIVFGVLNFQNFKINRQKFQCKPTPHQSLVIVYLALHSWPQERSKHSDSSSLRYREIIFVPFSLRNHHDGTIQPTLSSPRPVVPSSRRPVRCRHRLLLPSTLDAIPQPWRCGTRISHVMWTAYWLGTCFPNVGKNRPKCFV